MKVYVLGYQQRDEDKVQPPKRPFDPIDAVDVQFCKEPVWMIPYRELAESELRILQDVRVRVGPHYCELSIEEFPDGRFGIVCASHPSLVSREPVSS